MQTQDPKAGVIRRLKRIEGQLRGVQRMVTEGASCSDILIQVAAAMKKVGAAIVHSHLEECRENLIPKFEDRQKQSLREFQTAPARYIDWA